MLYSIAEAFDSIQGEGVYSGTRMRFIRTAGCCVGRKYEGRKADLFPDWQRKCTTWDGRDFPCDTDYQGKFKATEDDLIDVIPEDIKHVCLTGGEPLMWDLTPLVSKCFKRQLMVHIETSGVIDITSSIVDSELEKNIWVTMSPKYAALPSMYDRANEFKILVSGSFDNKQIPEAVTLRLNVFLQPIDLQVGNKYLIDPSSLEKCINVLKVYPNWRLSLQLHKILGLR